MVSSIYVVFYDSSGDFISDDSKFVGSAIYLCVILIMKNIIKFCLLFLVCWLSLELVLYGFKDVLLKPILRVVAFAEHPHPRISYVLKPGYRNKDSDVSINSDGFRGKELIKDPSPARRIVLAGASVPFGSGVKQSESVAEQLRTLLREENSVEVINAGVSGYNLEQTYYYILEKVLPLAPSEIVLVLPTNALYNINEHAYSKATHYGTLYKPQFGDSWLILNWLRKYSLVYGIAAFWKNNRTRPVSQEPSGLKEMPIMAETYTDQSWAKLKELLQSLVIKLNEKNVALYVLLVPYKYEISEQYPFDLEGYTLDRKKAANLHLFQPKVQAICQELQIPCVDMLPVYRQAYEQSGVETYTHNDYTHPNALGHHMMAEQIIQVLNAKNT